MRVVVLGASGFLGRHVLPALTAGGHVVVGASRRPIASAAGVEPFAADVVDGSWERALPGADALVNLVGIHHGHGAQSFAALHVELARRIAAAAVPRVVHLSVLCARPDARLAYFDSKARGDALILTHAAATVLRPAIVYAPDDGFSTRLRQMIGRRVLPIPGRGDALHAPVHADDVAAAVVGALANAATAGATLPLTGATTMTYAELVSELIRSSGHGCFTPHLPLGLMRIVARCTRWMREPPISEGQLAMITEGMAGDTRASWERLGVQPRGFPAGLGLPL